MKIGIILTGADGYKTTFVSIGQGLRDLGCEVVYFAEGREVNIIEPSSIDEEILYAEDLSVSDEEISDYVKTITNFSFGDINFSDIDRDISFKRRVKLFDEVLKANSQQYKLFHQYINCHKIDYILYEPISNSLSFNAFIASLYNNAKYISVRPSFISNRIEIGTYCEHNWRFVEPIKNTTSERYTLKDLEHLKKEFLKPPSYMKVNKTGLGLYKRLFTAANLKKLIRLLLHRIRYKRTKSSYLYGSIENMKLSMLRSNFRHAKNRMLIRYLKVYQNPPDQFFFYAMHFHPESSTSVNAKFFNDEYNNILAISNSLPFGKYLVVKEHPTGAGAYGIDFYRNIQYLPNVIFVATSHDSIDLITKSIGVITINGTVGMQALLLNKPVFHFAKSYYSSHKSAILIEHLDQLNNALCKKYDVSEIETLKLINRLNRNSFEGEMPINRPAEKNCIHSIYKSLELLSQV